VDPAPDSLLNNQLHALAAINRPLHTQEKSSITYEMEGLVGPGAGMDAIEKRKFYTLQQQTGSQQELSYMELV
jgi:hypothetical protein